MTYKQIATSRRPAGPCILAKKLVPGTLSNWTCVFNSWSHFLLSRALAEAQQALANSAKKLANELPQHEDKADTRPGDVTSNPYSPAIEGKGMHSMRKHYSGRFISHFRFFGGASGRVLGVL